MPESCPTRVARMNGVGNTKREVADNYLLTTIVTKRTATDTANKNGP